MKSESADSVTVIYVKFIATEAPTFFGYIISVLASVVTVAKKYLFLHNFKQKIKISPAQNFIFLQKKTPQNLSFWTKTRPKFSFNTAPLQLLS